jgi:hypothetical protein
LLAEYPTLAVAAGQGLAVFKLATDNIFQAVGGLNERLDKTTKQWRELTPEARKVAIELDAMKKPIRELSEVAQRNLFPGVEDGLKQLQDLQPVARGAVRDTAKELGNLADQAGHLLKSWGPDLETQSRRNVRWIGEGGDAALHFADAVKEVVLAAGPLTDWLVRGVDHWSHYIDAEAHAARKTGELSDFFKETRRTVEVLEPTVRDFGVALFNIFRLGYPQGHALLVDLQHASHEFRDWTQSASGRNAISDYFKTGREPIHEVAGLLHDLVIDFFQLGQGDQVAPLIRQVRTQLLPAIMDLVAGHDPRLRAGVPRLPRAGDPALHPHRRDERPAGRLHQAVRGRAA